MKKTDLEQVCQIKTSFESNYKVKSKQTIFFGYNKEQTWPAYLTNALTIAKSVEKTEKMTDKIGSLYL